ncbi:CBO0543 family protein [Bacillus massilinigeriensis]|uniref:CBO0543 family protein n=1 Tax=Bacillus massilionigeriensis TaxID=1805475 RepID=UPI00096B49C5|nr:CBO0543 family protein [Bacillus massilionigeriensis]
MSNNLENLNIVRNLEEKTTNLRIKFWLENELFSIEWWFLLIVILIIPWIIWMKFHEKSRTFELLLFGTLTMITAANLDSIGEDLAFWGYPVELIPAGHNAFPFNFGIVPVAFMLLHQYSSNWKSFSIGLFILAVLFAYVGEPFSQYIGVYKLFKWKFTYSFFYYIINGLLLRLFVIIIKYET